MEPEPIPERAHWPRWGSWLAGAFAIIANVVGVIQLVTETDRLLLILIAGLLAITGGGVWLWRLSGAERRARAQIFALNLTMVVVGAGLVGAAVDQAVDKRRPENSAGAENPPPAGVFTGTIRIGSLRQGWTLAPKDEVRGEVTGWKAGYQVWMSARADGAATEIVRGPCRVEAATAFICPPIELPGPSKNFLRVVVVTDAVAAGLREATSLPVSSDSYDEVQIYRG